MQLDQGTPRDFHENQKNSNTEENSYLFRCPFCEWDTCYPIFVLIEGFSIVTLCTNWSTFFCVWQFLIYNSGLNLETRYHSIRYVESLGVSQRSNVYTGDCIFWNKMANCYLLSDLRTNLTDMSVSYGKGCGARFKSKTVLPILNFLPIRLEYEFNLSKFSLNSVPT